MADYRKELKACPFCGVTDVSIRYAWLNGEILCSCSCNYCGVEMPIESTIGEAVTAWNTREGKKNG